jgi:DNA repair protein RadC
MQEQKYSIKQWAKTIGQRRITMNGAHTLSDSELLAILMLNGSKEKTAVDLLRCLET